MKKIRFFIFYQSSDIYVKTSKQIVRSKVQKSKQVFAMTFPDDFKLNDKKWFTFAKCQRQKKSEWSERRKMFSKRQPSKKTEDVKKSAAKVLDPKRDTPTRAKHLRIFLDNADTHETSIFFENHYSHIFYIVYDAFVAAELSLRQKGPHKAQREELEAVLYLLEKVKTKKAANDRLD